LKSVVAGGFAVPNGLSGPAKAKKLEGETKETLKEVKNVLAFAHAGAEGAGRVVESCCFLSV